MLYVGKLGTKLPAFAWLARPNYLNYFGRPNDGNGYYGMYRSRAEAESAAPATMLHTYDQPAPPFKYLQGKVSESDYPVVSRLSRIFGGGQSRKSRVEGKRGA